MIVTYMLMNLNRNRNENEKKNHFEFLLENKSSKKLELSDGVDCIGGGGGGGGGGAIGLGA